MNIKNKVDRYMEYYGYAGKILKVNLTDSKIEQKDLNLEEATKYLGSYGFGMKYLLDHLPPKVDPFSEKNIIVISAGILSGTLAPGTPKVSLITKYPTIADNEGKNWIGSSVAGGAFSYVLKNAGFDCIIITGKSKKPVFLEIIDDEIKLCDASEYWGKRDVVEVTHDFKMKYGDDSSVIAIGPAGENLVRQAMAFVDDTDSLGRSGLGAILGSKNLKAIVVCGTGGVKIADSERFMKRNKKVKDHILNWSGRDHWLKLGMGAGWHMFKYTQYPGKWTREKWDKLYGEPKRLETVEKVIGCPSCLISCRARWRIKDGEFKGNTGQGSPYGKSATSAQLLDIEDHRKTLQLVILANKAGIDFYTTTRMIDFVTQSFVDGKITEKDTCGMKLERSFECYVKLFNMIVKREGFGDVLADGWIGLKKHTNLDPQDYWYAGFCKGVDFIYDARAANLHPLMMSFFTNPRPHHGGSHTLTVGPGHSIEELKNEVKTWGLPEEVRKRIFSRTGHAGALNVSRYTKYMEDGMAMRNAMGCCSIYAFYGFIFPDDIADFFSAATGIEMSNYDILKAGERIMNLKKLLNVREGFNRKDDKVPDLWKRPMYSPEGKIVTQDYFKEKNIEGEDFIKILDDYYDERGWDKESGVPTEEKLKQLGMEEYKNIVKEKVCEL